MAPQRSLRARAARLRTLASQAGVGTVLNHLVAAWAVRRRPPWVPSWPRFLQVEVSSRCNMACPQCARSTMGVPDQGLMGIDRFRRLLGQFRYVQYLTLHGLGEPLLNPWLSTMAREAKERWPTARIGLNTNGLLLSGEKARELAQAGVDEIGVSLDAASPSTHAQVRGGGFEEIVERVREVRHTPQTPSLALCLVVMEPNVRELVSFVELASSLRVEAVSFCDLSARWRRQGGDPMAVVSVQEARAGAQAAEERARALGIRFTYTRLDTTLWPGAAVPCFYLWDYPYVTWEGEVTPCCALPYAQMALADLDRVPFRRVWNGEAYRSMRRSLVRGRPPAPCEGCHHAAPFLR